MAVTARHSKLPDGKLRGKFPKCGAEAAAFIDLLSLLQLCSLR